MSISAAAIYQATQQGADTRRSSSSRRSESAVSLSSMPVDTYEPSRPLGANQDRKAHIEDVKSRVSSGYYNRPDIVEDISDAFAKYFDKAIR